MPIRVGWRRPTRSKARLRNTFDLVPDAPVSKFRLELHGGKRGLVVNSTNICAKQRKAKLALTAQNGLLQNSEPVIKTSCKKAKPKKHKGTKHKKG